MKKMGIGTGSGSGSTRAARMRWRQWQHKSGQDAVEAVAAPQERPRSGSGHMATAATSMASTMTTTPTHTPSYVVVRTRSSNGFFPREDPLERHGECRVGPGGRGLNCSPSTPHRAHRRSCYRTSDVVDRSTRNVSSTFTCIYGGYHLRSLRPHPP